MNLNRLVLMGVVAVSTLACSAISSLVPGRPELPTVAPASPIPTQALPTALPASTVAPTEEPPTQLQLPTTTFDSTIYAEPHREFTLQYPQAWLIKTEESDTVSVCESNAAVSACFTVQLREASGDVQAFADEILIGLESSVSDYFAAPSFQSTTSDNLPILWNYVEYTYQDVSWAGQLAFVVNGRRGYYITAMAQAERYREVEGLFTEMILTMRFGG